MVETETIEFTKTVKDNGLQSLELDPSRKVGHICQWDEYLNATLMSNNSTVEAVNTPSIVLSKLTSSRSIIWLKLEELSDDFDSLKFGIALVDKPFTTESEKSDFLLAISKEDNRAFPKLYFDCGEVGKKYGDEIGAILDTEEGWVEVYGNMLIIDRYSIPKKSASEYCFFLSLSSGHTVSIVTDCSQCDFAYELGTPDLIAAAAHGHFEWMKLLLRSGVRLDERGVLGMDALFAAVFFGHIECLKYLLKKAVQYNINDSFVFYENAPATLLHFAALRGHVQCLRLILERGANVDLAFELGSALHFAARSANTDCVRVLLAYGANVNLLGKENGPTPVQCAVRAQSADCTRLLLEHGANMNSPDQDGLLHYAVLNNYVECVKLCLCHGADVNQVNKDGDTPLMVAVRANHLECVHLLLDEGANVNPVNGRDSSTPLDIAASYGYTECLTVLLDRGAIIDGTSFLRPLNSAIYGYNLECAKVLLKGGADVNKISLGKNQLTQTFDPYAVEILAYGGKIPRYGLFARNWYATCSNDGKTPLHRAVEDRVLASIPALIEAYPKALVMKDNRGMTPFDLAADAKDESVLWLLMPYERSISIESMYGLLFAATRMTQRVIQSVHIHLLGHGYAGKTTCRKALNYTLKYLNPLKFAMSGSPRNVLVDRSNGSGKTEGMEMDEVESPHHKWLIRDYGGQEDFHVNHARFLSVPGSVYVIVVALWDEENQKPFTVEEVKSRYLYWLKFLNSVSDCTITLSCATIINFAEKVGKQFTVECVAAIEYCMAIWKRQPSQVQLYGQPCALSVNKVSEVRKLNDLIAGAAKMSEEVNSFPVMSYILSIEDAYDNNVRKMHGKLTNKSTFIGNVCKPAICKLLSESRIPTGTLSVDFVCEKMISYLSTVGTIIIVPTNNSQDPLVVLDVNWLSSELLGSLINRMTSTGNAEYVLTASQINSFTNNGGKYFGGVDGLVAFLESIGACIVVKDGDSSETKRWFPLCSQRKFVVGKECIPMEKGMWVSFRKAVRLFSLSDPSHQMFPPGYFLDLFLKILSLFSMKNATTVKVFINGFEVEYQFPDAVVQVLIIALDDNCGFTVEVSLVSELNSPNRAECWKRFNRICDVILNAKHNTALKDMIRVSPWFNNVMLTEMFVNPKDTANKDAARDGNKKVRELRNTKSLEDLKELDESVQNLYIYGCNERDMPVDEKDPPKHILEVLFYKMNEMQQFLVERWNTVTVTLSSDMIEDAFRGMMKTLQGDVSQEIQTMMETTRQALTADTLTLNDLNSALDKMKNDISVCSSNDKVEVMNELKLIQDTMTELTSEVKSIQQLNDKKLQESILRAMKECKTLHKLDKMMKTMLKGTHDIPTMTIVIPVGDPSMFNPSNWTSNEYALFFVCTHTHQVVPCGPGGKGYKFRRAKDWFKKVAPVIKVCLIAAKIALTVTGIPIPINGVMESLNEMSDAVATSTQYLNKALSVVDAANKAADGLGIAVGNAGSGVDDSSVDSAEQYVKSLDGLLKQSDTVEAYKSLKALLDEVDPSLSSVGVEKVTSSSGVTGWVKKGDQAVIDSFMRDEKWPMKIAELKESYNAVAGAGATDASSKSAASGQSKLGVRSGLWLPKSLFGIGVGTRK